MANLPPQLRGHLFPLADLGPTGGVQQPSLDTLRAHYPPELVGPSGVPVPFEEYIVLRSLGWRDSIDDIAAMQALDESTTLDVIADLMRRTREVQDEIVAFSEDPAHRLQGDVSGETTAYTMMAYLMHDGEWRKSGDPHLAHAVVVGQLAYAATNSWQHYAVGLLHDGPERFNSHSASGQKPGGMNNSAGQRLSRYSIPDITPDAALLSTSHAAEMMVGRYRTDAEAASVAQSIDAVSKRVFLGHEKERLESYRRRVGNDIGARVVKYAADEVHNFVDPPPLSPVEQIQRKHEANHGEYLADIVEMAPMLQSLHGVSLTRFVDALPDVVKQAIREHDEWAQRPEVADFVRSRGATAVRFSRLPFDETALAELQAELHKRTA